MIDIAPSHYIYGVSQKKCVKFYSCRFVKLSPIFVIFGTQHQHTFKNASELQQNYAIYISLCL